MKKELVLIRHTKSSWGNFSLPDFDRPLKKDRIDDAHRMAVKLKQLNLQLDLIICSPALRTKQTAGHFCNVLGYDFNKINFDSRLYESSAEEYLKVIQQIDSRFGTVIIIGHNPSITDLTSLLLNERTGEIPTTGTVWLEFESKGWKISKETIVKLKHFLTPKAI